MKTTMKKEEIIETALVVLPAEVQTLALAVPEKKREEVESVLAQIFQGTADWKAQVEALEVKGISDSMNIALADTYRLNAKKARLAAEKVFDAKREEVQAQMAGFKTEDALWLKSKQVMQILFKEIEDLAEYKSKFAQRYESEQRELRTQSRKLKVQELNSEVSQAEYENMSEATFDMFLGGLRNDKDAKDKVAWEEAELAEEKRLAEICHKERKDSLIEYWAYVPAEHRALDLSTLTDAEWTERFEWTKAQKVKADEDAKAQAAENLRLQKLADEKEKQLVKEREDAEKTRKELLEKQAAELRVQQEAADKRQKGLMAENKKREEEAAAKQKLADDAVHAERVVAAKKQADLEAELTARNKKEAEAEFALQAEFVAQEKARQAALLAPRKEKLEAWVMGMLIIAPTGLGDDALVNDIIIKFDGFKKWAKIEIEKL